MCLNVLCLGGSVSNCAVSLCLGGCVSIVCVLVCVCVCVCVCRLPGAAERRRRWSDNTSAGSLDYRRWMGFRAIRSSGVSLWPSCTYVNIAEYLIELTQINMLYWVFDLKYTIPTSARLESWSIMSLNSKNLSQL